MVGAFASVLMIIVFQQNRMNLFAVCYLFNVITVSAKDFKPFFFLSKFGSEKYFLTLEIVHGIIAKLLSDWEQNILYTKS